MSKPLQILIPMGGLGQRFRDAGYTTPKPLIEAFGVPLFQRALESFKPYTGPKKHIFVVRQDAEAEYQLATQIRKLQPDAQIAMLDKNTRGAVETCMLARDLIDDDDPLVIMDCDLYFESKEYFDYLRAMAEQQKYDGVLVTFQSQDPRYSYAIANGQGVVTKTAEKIVISDRAIWGAYAFGTGKLFKEAATELLAQPLNDTMKEYYTSYLYNALISDGRVIKLAHSDYAESYGTPEELAEVLLNHPRTAQ